MIGPILEKCIYFAHLFPSTHHSGLSFPGGGQGCNHRHNSFSAFWRPRLWSDLRLLLRSWACRAGLSCFISVFACLYFFLSVLSLFVSLSRLAFLCLSLSVYPFFFPPLSLSLSSSLPFLSVSVSFGLYLSLCLCLHLFLPLSLFLSVSVCLSVPVSLSVFLCLCISISLPLSLSLPSLRMCVSLSLFYLLPHFHSLTPLVQA